MTEAVKAGRESYRPFELSQANRAHRVHLPLITPLGRAEIIHPKVATLPESFYIPSRRRGLVYRCGGRRCCIKTPSLGSRGSSRRSSRRGSKLANPEKNRVCDALKAAGDEGVSLLMPL